MSEEDNVAGNDQTNAEETQGAGEGQQAEPQTVEYMGRQLTPDQLKEELVNTNAYVTKLQQQQAQAQQQDPQQEVDQEVDESAVTPEQRKLIQRLAGADELRKEIADLKKERENEQQQAQQKQLDEEFSSISKDFKESGVPLPTTIPEKEKLIQYMNETRIFNPRVAFEHMHSTRLEQAKESKAATSDKGDTKEATRQSEYKQAIANSMKDGRRPSIDELAAIEAKFKGDPTMFAPE